MRAIEFRAYDARRKKMVYRTLFEMNWYYTDKNDENGCHLAYGIAQRDRNTLEVMQYTGLKDRNGVKIFEGDIVKYLDWLPKIITYGDPSNPVCGFVLSKTLGTLYENDSNDMEVIGNIYESPELLEQK